MASGCVRIPRLSADLLLMEDDARLGQMLALALSDQGFRVGGSRAASRRSARRKPRRPDAVLLDLILPGIDGVEVCGRLRSLGDMPIIDAVAPLRPEAAVMRRTAQPSTRTRSTGYPDAPSGATGVRWSVCTSPAPSVVLAVITCSPGVASQGRNH